MEADAIAIGKIAVQRVLLGIGDGVSLDILLIYFLMKSFLIDHEAANKADEIRVDFRHVRRL